MSFLIIFLSHILFILFLIIYYIYIFFNLCFTTLSCIQSTFTRNAQHSYQVQAVHGLGQTGRLVSVSARRHSYVRVVFFVGQNINRNNKSRVINSGIKTVSRSRSSGTELASKVRAMIHSSKKKFFFFKQLIFLKSFYFK